MRILILVDNADDLRYYGHPELLSPLEAPGVRRDLATYLSTLDANRVQPQFAAVEGAGENSLNASGRIDWSALRRLIALLHEQDIELIHALGPKAMIYTALAGRRTGLPTIGSMYDMQKFDEMNAFQQISERVLHYIRRWGINRIVVPSQLLIKQSLWHVRYPS